MKYPVNKGAGNPVEFKGLKSQYLFVFAGGLVMVLLAVVILYLVGVDQWICISFGSISGGLLVWMTFRLNARYGEPSKKATKPNAKNPQGGIIEQESAIHISNLQVLDPKSGKPTRIGRKQNAAGKLVRFAKKSGEEIK